VTARLRRLAGDWLLVLRLAHAYNCCDTERAERLRREMYRREYRRELARAR
jgi:hypothetical protein